MTRRVLLDAAGALALFGFCVLVGPALSHTQPDARHVDGLSTALAAAACLGVALRSRWPLAGVALSTVAVSAYLTIGYPYGPVILTVSLTVYTIVVSWRPRQSAVASGAALVVLFVHLLTWGTGSALVAVAPASAWVAVPFAVGTAVRLTRQGRARERAADARRVADDERLRVAQEVHDVVGHGLAAITLQAEIALHLLPTKPEQAETALTAISTTSREALDELRTTLAAVRGGGPDERAPTAGLARLDALTERITASGTPVTASVSGAPRELPAAVDLAAYRVVQESLTNVLRHAGPATATVLIDYRPDTLRLEVADTGGVSGPVTEGHGIAGMRERVTALGGSFSAGAGPRGFRVSAVFPVA
jgi:signal transduction histidine kinase